MNVQEYILSGIVESYVLGLANDEERLEFERMCSTYSQVDAAREAFELALEKQALEQAIVPPAALKNRIFSTIGIDATNGDSKESNFVESVIPPQTPLVKMRWAQYIAAASLVLLVTSTALNFYFFREYKKYSYKYDELIASQSQMANANKVLQTKLQDYESAMNMINSPQMAVIKMAAVPTSPNPTGLATIYWDTKSKDVYLLVNSLPQPTPDKQYQLWAIVDGKPVDAGVFDINEGLSFAKMKNIPKAQAFAVTLERHGGAESPTMQAMYVLGKVSG